MNKPENLFFKQKMKEKSVRHERAGTTKSTDSNQCSKSLNLEDFIKTEEDQHYEEELLQNPFSLKSWCNYIDYRKSKGVARIVNLSYERAVRALPGSYKLWFAYLDCRVKQVRGSCITDEAYEAVNNCFERALTTMHKMPRIWLEYCSFLNSQKKITRTRRVHDRALQSLPITQHKKIWTSYIKFIRQKHVPAATGMRIYQRYIKVVEPKAIEDYVDYLISVKCYDEACKQLSKLVNDDEFESTKGKTKQDFWLLLCEIIKNYPDQITQLNIDPIIRGGIRKYPSEVGQLWCALATYYINLGHFEMARDVYEEGIETVMTVKDFTLIFDAYAKFEEEIIAIKMQSQKEEEEEEQEEDHSEQKDGLIFSNDDDLEMKIARLEYLMDRRPLLLSSVKLRQNPHNVHEWLKRVKLYVDSPEKIVQTYSDAVQTVDPTMAVGNLHALWISFARYYERNYDDLATARTIFERGVNSQFKHVDDLAELWCEYAEMEIRHNQFHRARALLQRATAVPKEAKNRKYFTERDSAQLRLHKNVKIWSFYVDLEESLGSFESTRSVYERILELKVATPTIILNYAQYLEEHKYFEEAFRIYEKGANLFHYPQVYHIWIMYLVKFMKRYGGKKIERARDLFEQAVERVPREYAKGLYLMYAKLEEDYGLAKRAMDIYDRATKAVKEEEKLPVFRIYINRAAEFFGVTKTRDIYEKAISTLSDKHIKDICLQYAEMERKLGEIDRSRAIFAHAARYCDPRTEKKFWELWEGFEKNHGNIETFKDMLRIKNSVQVTLSTNNLMTSAMIEAQKEMQKQQKLRREQVGQKRAREDALQQLEKELEQIESSNPQVEQDLNEEEISIEMEQVPETVFKNNIR